MTAAVPTVICHLLLRLNELYIEADLTVFADQHAAGFEGRVPGEPEVLAIDFGGAKGQCADCPMSLRAR